MARPGPQDVVFTQYLRPDGHPVHVWTPVPADVKVLADALRDLGYAFACEELRTGEVSLTVEDPHDDEPVAILVVPNGPDVPPAVEQLIRTAARGRVTRR